MNSSSTFWKYKIKKYKHIHMYIEVEWIVYKEIWKNINQTSKRVYVPGLSEDIEILKTYEPGYGTY